MKKLLFTIFIFTALFAPFLSARAAEPVKILLVPGHDNEIWGAQYGNVKEAAMNLAVAKRIYNILKKDKRFEVHITRDLKGYTKEFADYFSANAGEIVSFRDKAKNEWGNKVESGDIIEREAVPHNSATEDVSIILYGINKWANENKMDAVIHIHFNDYPRKDAWTIGKHTGFAVYMPDGQMPNFQKSGTFAANIAMELEKKYNTSTYEKEKGGLIADQKLIALGSNGTLLPFVRSVLMEYGYIYEKKFRNYTTRHQAYDDMAKLTAAGIKNYFFHPTPPSP
ncbi:N-acetylmuramoyl-L-alanine amidase [Candidatus Nomurabacteria bacterium]|nr:N-acetylmuramoyl-L-alanine amidase [Candidatus Nomurabacteria bacterium]